jgi:Zinc finger C-x8-C-x5-C-x3-H type (and similar)
MKRFDMNNDKPIGFRVNPSIASLYQGETLLDVLETEEKIPSREKFRRMICMTFVATGGCPYNDRCCYLHDPRLRIEGIRTKPIKSQLPVLPLQTKDTFFWPDMKVSDNTIDYSSDLIKVATSTPIYQLIIIILTYFVQ